MPVRENVAIGVVDMENLLYIVNDPMKVEQEAARDAKSGHELDGYARMRAEVQRVIGTAASPKSKNIASYADYISDGLSGEFGDAWSVPPVTLWCQRPTGYRTGRFRISADPGRSDRDRRRDPDQCNASD